MYVTAIGVGSLSTSEVYDLSHAKQSWRPDELTEEFIYSPPNGNPFCPNCADWHATDDVCSQQDNDNN